MFERQLFTLCLQPSASDPLSIPSYLACSSSPVPRPRLLLEKSCLRFRHIMSCALFTRHAMYQCLRIATRTTFTLWKGPWPRLDSIKSYRLRLRTMATSSGLPQSMRGILSEKTGGTEVLQYKTDLPIPQPKEGEILVKNDFIGINYIDTYQKP